MLNEPTRPGDPAPLVCSICQRQHVPAAPPRGQWAQVSCCGYTTTLYWSTDGTLRADGYCDPRPVAEAVA